MDDPAAVALALATLRAEGDEHAAAELMHLLEGEDEPEPETKAVPSSGVRPELAALLAKLEE